MRSVQIVGSGIGPRRCFYLSRTEGALILFSIVRDTALPVTAVKPATTQTASRTSIFAMLPPSLTPAAATAAWNSLVFAPSSALSL